MRVREKRNKTDSLGDRCVPESRNLRSFAIDVCALSHIEAAAANLLTLCQEIPYAAGPVLLEIRVIILMMREEPQCSI